MLRGAEFRFETRGGTHVLWLITEAWRGVGNVTEQETNHGNNIFTTYDTPKITAAAHPRSPVLLFTAKNSVNRTSRQHGKVHFLRSFFIVNGWENEYLSNSYDQLDYRQNSSCSYTVQYRPIDVMRYRWTRMSVTLYFYHTPPLPHNYRPG